MVGGFPPLSLPVASAGRPDLERFVLAVISISLRVLTRFSIDSEEVPWMRHSAGVAWPTAISCSVREVLEAWYIYMNPAQSKQHYDQVAPHCPSQEVLKVACKFQYSLVTKAIGLCTSTQPATASVQIQKASRNRRMVARVSSTFG